MVSRGIIRGSVALIVAAVATVLNPAPSQAVEAGWTGLNNGKTELVMAIRGGVNAGPGADAVAWWPSYVTGSQPGDQKWKMQNIGGNYGHYWIRNAGTANQYALSVKGNGHTNGTPVIQWWFDATNLWERWDLISHGDGWLQFKNVGAEYYHDVDMCVAIEGGGGAPSTIKAGSRLILWTCGAGRDQQWHDDTYGND